MLLRLKRVIRLLLILSLVAALNGCYAAPKARQPGLERRIIGVIENVKVYTKDGEHYREIKAKIDTGAESSSIDEKLACQLGFDEALHYYKSFDVDKVMSEEEVGVIKNGKIKKKLESHPDIVEAVTVRSVHGATYRIKIPLLFYIAGIKIKTNVTVADRENLKYPMIIGRRDLDGFLVDISRE